MSVFHVAVKGLCKVIHTRQLSDDAGDYQKEKFAERLVVDCTEWYPKEALYVMECDQNGEVLQKWSNF